MSFGSRFEYPKRAGVFVVSLNFLISVLTIVFICTLSSSLQVSASNLFFLVISSSFGDFQDDYSVMNLLLVVTHSLCLLILSCSMLWYGIRLQQKLGNSSLKAIPGKNRKIAILVRINTVLFICCVCFFLRIIALGLLCTDIILGNTFTDRKILLMGWFIISNWIPTCLPVSK